MFYASVWVFILLLLLCLLLYKEGIEEINKEKFNDKQRKSAKRANQSAETKKEENTKKKNFMAKKRNNEKTSLCVNEALNSHQILNGSYIVPEIKDTNDKVGKMDTKCQYCQALKFKNESSTTCCSNGKVMLERFPKPPEKIDRLWHNNDVQGRMFRENARSINNAVCLASLQVQQRSFKKGFNPSVIF